jgi:hypothetical protein
MQYNDVVMSIHADVTKVIFCNEYDDTAGEIPKMISTGVAVGDADDRKTYLEVVMHKAKGVYNPQLSDMSVTTLRKAKDVIVAVMQVPKVLQ